MPRPGRTISPSTLGAAIPDLLMGLVFLVAWIDPSRLGARPIPGLVLVMLLEFIVVHSGGFAGKVILGDAERGKKIAAMLGLGLFYTLFAAGFALAFRTWWPVASFWALMLNRMLSLLLGQAGPGDERALAMRGWAAGALFYLGFAMLTTILPLPRLGLTPEVVSGQHLPGEGLWIAQPWRVMAFGFLYFAAIGISELRAHRWTDRGLPEHQADAA